MCTYVCACAAVRATVHEYHTSAVYPCGPCTHLYVRMYRGGILLFTVCGSLSAPAQLKHEVEWLRRYGKVDSESLSDHVISDCECDCVCIALICLFCVHAVWCVWRVMNRGGGGGRTVCVYIHMCVCVCHCTHMQSEMTCVLARALGEPVWLVCGTQSCHLSRLDQHWHFHYTSPTTYMLEYALVLQSCVHTDIHTYVHTQAA